MIEPGPPFKCPTCGGRLDTQGGERKTWTVYDTWCHHCVAHITIRIKAR